MQKILIYSPIKKEREFFKITLSNFYNLILTDHFDQAEEFLHHDPTIHLSLLKCDLNTVAIIEQLAEKFQKNKIFIYEDLNRPIETSFKLPVLPTPLNSKNTLEFIQYNF